MRRSAVPLLCDLRFCVNPFFPLTARPSFLQSFYELSLLHFPARLRFSMHARFVSLSLSLYTCGTSSHALLSFYYTFCMMQLLV